MFNIADQLAKYEGNLFTEPEKGAPRDYREEIIKPFLDRVNADRGRRGPISWSRFLKRLKDAGFDTRDKEAAEIKAFKEQCQMSHNFGKAFWGITKFRIDKIKHDRTHTATKTD